MDYFDQKEEIMDYNSDTERSNSIGLVTRTYSLDGQMGVKEKRNRLAFISNDLNRLTSVSGVSQPTNLNRSKSTAVLKFINKADDVAGWAAVEERFVKITATTDGLLPRSKFGECIGWDSEDFASALFDSLLRRRSTRTDMNHIMINKEELRDFWEQMSDQSFDSRLETFFNMVDKDSDGRITEDEVCELINLSLAANNLSNIQSRKEEYAALIMEELDPDKTGYITVESFECLLMHAEEQNVRKTSKGSKDLSAKLKTTLNPNLFKRYNFETLMHLTAPTALYACERLIRAFRSSTVTLSKVAVYPANVLNLIMSRPKNFEYRSGQYILINCPSVSQFEWHPFSITSAPQDDYLSVLIKSVGDWTEAVRNKFTEMCRPPQDGDANNLGFPKIVIDGPYGAPAQDYKKYEVVLLIGLGIGAAPMISIVKDINQNTEANEHTQQHQQGNNKESFKTQKAYFYWLTKEQGSYSWFYKTMNEIAERDASNVIELHNYCTSIYEEGDARSAMILMLQSLNHAKHGVDIISGTRIMTHFAKPNWRNVYKQIARDRQGSHVGVFYCGELALAKELRHLAVEFTLGTTTRFTFHKENFYPQC